MSSLTERKQYGILPIPPKRSVLLFLTEDEFIVLATHFANLFHFGKALSPTEERLWQRISVELANLGNPAVPHAELHTDNGDYDC